MLAYGRSPNGPNRAILHSIRPACGRGRQSRNWVHLLSKLPVFSTVHNVLIFYQVPQHSRSGGSLDSR